MMNPPVFFGAAGFVIVLIVFGSIWTELAGRIFEQTLTFITDYLSWYYVLIVTFFLLFVIWLYFSNYGRIRIGGQDAKPEFSRFGWFSMMFAAGTGIGLVFWGVAEPIMHYSTPPRAQPETMEALKEGMRFSFFHWGFHAWAIYIIFGMAIAYFHFRHKLPLAPRSLFYPLIGDKAWGPAGHFIDAFSTVGTLLGVATSLGLGAMQINSGFNALIEIPDNTRNQVIIIAVITAVATTSTITGVKKGIRFLSKANLVLMISLLVFVFIAGPTLYHLRLFLTTFGDYLQHLVEMSLWVDVRPESEWQDRWTIFYWGWWISWCPFVGIFIARISKGRTIREFILSVMFIPSLLTFLWFSIFGGTALHLELAGNHSVSQTVSENVSMSLHALLAELPLADITQWTGLLLVIIFFITSSDSGSLVDDMVTSGGHPNPPPVQRAFWGVSEGAAAAVLLVSGGLNALQTASISAGLLQSIFLIIACISLFKALRIDSRTEGIPSKKKLKKGVDNPKGGDSHGFASE